MPEVTPPPVEPAAPAAPEPAAVPAEPVADEPTGPVTATPTPPKDERTDDEKEWDEAEKELVSDDKGEKNEPAESKEASKKEDEGSKAGEAEKPDEKSDNADEAAKTEVPQSDTARDLRIAQREHQEEVATVRADIVEKMFADVPSELADADGDPIKTIEDVMQRIDPRTGEAFTEEAAGLWLLSAQQQFNQQKVDREARIDHIAEVNITIKDEADIINSKFSTILEANPELRQELWAAFEKTLVKDSESGVIVDMPVSLEMFYSTALKPYAQQAKASEDSAKLAAEAEAKAKADEEANRQKKRTDRSDIYANGKTDNLSTEDKEWAEAEKEVLGI